MSIAVSMEPRIRDVRVTDDSIIAYLVDGRIISVPLAWSWRLSEAAPAERAHFEIIGDGHGIHWPDLDEDISVDGMLHGMPARRPQTFVHFRDPHGPGSRESPKKRLAQTRKTPRPTSKH